MFDWNKIRRIRRFGYLLLVLNIGLAILLSNKHSKYHKETEAPKGAVAHIVAKRGVNMRAQPDANSSLITSIGNNESVTILSDTSSTNKGWVKVYYNGSEGWVWGSYLSR